MTCDERLAALGVDLSDLPSSYSMKRANSYNLENAVMSWTKASADYDEYLCMMTFDGMHRQYILHLTDVIDRMETQLVNLIGERDYLARCLFEGVPEDWRADDDQL